MKNFSLFIIFSFPLMIIFVERNIFKQNEIETILADEVLFGKLEDGGEVRIDLKKDQLSFKYS